MGDCDFNGNERYARQDVIVFLHHIMPAVSRQAFQQIHDERWRAEPAIPVVENRLLDAEFASFVYSMVFFSFRTLSV